MALVADLGPLEDDFEEHPDVHGGDAEPEYGLLPVAEFHTTRKTTKRITGQETSAIQGQLS